MKKGLWILWGLTLLMIALVGCGAQMTSRASPDWSKGERVGITPLNNEVAIQARDDEVYLVWVDGEHRLHGARLDQRATIVEEKPLDLSTSSPQWPRLLSDAEGGLHLFWIAGEKERGLYYVGLDPAGEVVGEPLLLSPPGVEVAYVDLTLGPEGEIEVFWSPAAHASPGIYHLTINPQGEVTRGNSLLLPEGIAPSLQVDQRGMVHLSWLQVSAYNARQVYYAPYDPKRAILKPPTQVAEVVFMGGQAVEGPALGLDTKNVYIFWSVETRGRASTGETYYATFPVEEPSQCVVHRLRVPRLDRPRYAPYEGQYDYRVLASWEGISTLAAPSDFVTGAGVVSGQREELPVAFSMSVVGRFGEQLQIVIVVFSGGDFRGYQLITATKQASLTSSLVADPHLDLHLVWLDTAGFEEYTILYASTSPEVKEVLNRVTLADLVDKAGSVAMALLLVVGFTPLMVAWLFLPLLWLVVFYFLSGEGELSTFGSWLAWGMAILIQILAMVLISPGGRILPSLVSSLPQAASFFTGWPFTLVLALLALAVAIFYLRRTGSRSLFGAFFVFAFTIGFLRLFFFTLTYLGYI